MARNPFTPTPNELDAVWAVLQDHHGRGQAISRRTLAARTGLPDRRLRAAIHELIAAGRLVGSLPTGGYFVITDSSELADVVTYYRSYAYELLERARALELTYAQAEQQTMQEPLFR